jgi:hypothetical protein
MAFRFDDSRTEALIAVLLDHPNGATLIQIAALIGAHSASQNSGRSRIADMLQCAVELVAMTIEEVLRYLSRYVGKYVP